MAEIPSEVNQPGAANSDDDERSGSTTPKAGGQEIRVPQNPGIDLSNSQDPSSKDQSSSNPIGDKDETAQPRSLPPSSMEDGYPASEDPRSQCTINNTSDFPNEFPPGPDSNGEASSQTPSLSMDSVDLGNGISAQAEPSSQNNNEGETSANKPAATNESEDYNPDEQQSTGPSRPMNAKQRQKQRKNAKKKEKKALRQAETQRAGDAPNSQTLFNIELADVNHPSFSPSYRSNSWLDAGSRNKEASDNAVKMIEQRHFLSQLEKILEKRDHNSQNDEQWQFMPVLREIFETRNNNSQNDLSPDDFKAIDDIIKMVKQRGFLIQLGEILETQNSISQNGVSRDDMIAALRLMKFKKEPPSHGGTESDSGNVEITVAHRSQLQPFGTSGSDNGTGGQINHESTSEDPAEQASPKSPQKQS
ncbi:hypothetical protein F5X99DRAFT_423363 [Biscogniauxia marginata]|nr:hypothetical protein F5X99DRAFT_423363 [Biscogniauxia marginata]